MNKLTQLKNKPVTQFQFIEDHFTDNEKIPSNSKPPPTPVRTHKKITLSDLRMKRVKSTDPKG